MEEFVIVKAVKKDLDTICMLFEEAILFQKMNNYIGWESYDRAYLQTDIENGLLYKIINKNEGICIFSICYRDELIWRKMEKGNALYLHRIVLNRRFKDGKVFIKVLNWAVDHARQNQLRYIRMDTWATNEKIIGYYKSYGFAFIENYTTPGSENLPLQHRNLNVALLEMNVDHYKKHTDFADANHTHAEVKMFQQVNIRREFSSINQYWSQRIIGQANGQLIKLAKGKGEINWHKHEDQDELFLIYNGHLTIQLREKNIELFKDEMFIVPKGVEHCPKANEETAFLIMGLNITSNLAGGRPASMENNGIE